MDDSDVTLPKATLQKLIKDFLPQDMRMSSELTELLIKCCTEFIPLVSSEANELCSKENKNTIHPEHVVKALQDLGFPEYYIEEMNQAYDGWKQENQGFVRLGNRKTAAEEAGLTEEEQIALQQKMFAEARARSMSLAAENASGAPTSAAT